MPHRAQKSRTAREEDWKVEGSPRVQANSVHGTSARTVKGPAAAFWHMRQWQMPIFPGCA